MPTRSLRSHAKSTAISRKIRKIKPPMGACGKQLKVSEFFGENVFDIETAKNIPEQVRKELLEVTRSYKPITEEQARIVATAVTKWATEHNCTHFCHWFQPLTGGTAEKHDAFLSLEKGQPIEKLTHSQLLQGEPDASSFPHGGTRSTFEARGYTSWDLSSPMFIINGPCGNTLCIPTAFISYRGQALDMKTPLLRSLNRMSKVASEFLSLISAEPITSVETTIGCEQEYFLIDRAFYFARPDMVMTGRALFGSNSTKHQQLEDHYFGAIPERVIAFMQELDTELYKLGIPVKTRHNEVAPGQYELAPIFQTANVAADQNQLVMANLRTIAARHNFEVMLHEKPFSGVNGSGKHVNWSLCDNRGNNLLEPGKSPYDNLQFLAVVAIVCEAVYRHAGALRMSIASSSNDHRLGANEAPPAIMSVFLGDTIEKIFNQIKDGKEVSKSNAEQFIEVGAQQLARLAKDNTDRNRTSPFAFTGNKFEFRAVGSSMNIGFPVSILNSAVAEVFEDSTALLKKFKSEGLSVDECLLRIAKTWAQNSHPIVFGGDGYSSDWVDEAKARGLENLKSTPEAIAMLKDEKKTKFLTDSGVYSQSELSMRFNTIAERYNTLREIEFETLVTMVNQSILPDALEFKSSLASSIRELKSAELGFKTEKLIFDKIDKLINDCYELSTRLTKAIHELPKSTQPHDSSLHIAAKIFPLSQELAEKCSQIEDIVPDELWSLPKFRELLFLR